jgi:hypothetical protein
VKSRARKRKDGLPGGRITVMTGRLKNAFCIAARIMWPKAAIPMAKEVSKKCLV